MHLPLMKIIPNERFQKLISMFKDQKSKEFTPILIPIQRSLLLLLKSKIQ